MFCIVTLQKTSSIQTPNLFTDYPYTNGFQVVGVYSTVTMISWISKMKLHTFLFKDLLIYLCTTNKHSISVSLCNTFIYTKKRSTGTLAPSAKRISKPEESIWKGHVVQESLLFLPSCVTTTHPQFTSHGTRINYRPLLIRKKCWQMGTSKKTPELALLTVLRSLETTSFSENKRRMGLGLGVRHRAWEMEN